MEQSKINGFRKGLIISIVGLIVLFFIVGTVGFWSLKPMLSKRLKSAVLESTDSLYYLDFKDINYQIITGQADILAVTWRVDTNRYERLKKAKKMPDNIYQGKVNGIKLAGLHP